MAATHESNDMDTVQKSVRRLNPSLLLTTFVVNLLLLVSAIYMLQVYDRVLSSGSLDTLIWLTIAAFGALAIYGVLEHVRRLILGRASYWIETALGEPVLRKAMADRLAGKTPVAGLGDVAALRQFYGGDAKLAFLDAPWTPAFIAFIWLIHPGLGMLAIFSAVVLFALALTNDLLTRSPQKKLSGDLRQNEIRARSVVESGETIVPLGMGDALLNRWKTNQVAARQEYQGLREITSRLLSASKALRLVFQVMILGLGAYFVLQGTLTAGGMIAASIILGRALAPVERSISAWQSFVSARSAKARLHEMFSDAPEKGNAVSLPRPKGLLEVEGVYCLAPGSGEPILEDVSFRIEPGETMAIIGPSGSGKSTLCRLLVGAWAPARGHVRLDGANVSAWDPSDMGQYIGYLPQQVELFPGTVAENIARMQDAEDQQIIAAAKAAGVHDLILRLPQGYETDVGIHGGRISGGQRQRLGLARALFGDPAFVVLDEPSSNLDQSGDAALTEALKHLKQSGRTVVLVSHRAVGMRSADKVLVMSQGTVSAFGARDQILKVQNASPPKQVAKSVTANIQSIKAAAE